MFRYSNTLPESVLREFPNHAFVEGGISGSQLLVLADDIGFKELYAMDTVDTGVVRIRGLVPRAIAMCGDTRDCLPHILEALGGPTTFWLDAHDMYDSPLLDELKLVSEFRHLSGSVILIDDLRIIRSGNFWAKAFATATRSSWDAFRDHIDTLFGTSVSISYRDSIYKGKTVDDIMVIEC